MPFARRRCRRPPFLRRRRHRSPSASSSSTRFVFVARVWPPRASRARVRRGATPRRRFALACGSRRSRGGRWRAWRASRRAPVRRVLTPHVARRLRRRVSYPLGTETGRTPGRSRATPEAARGGTPAACTSSRIGSLPRTKATRCAPTPRRAPRGRAPPPPARRGATRTSRRAPDGLALRATEAVPRCRHHDTLLKNNNNEKSLRFPTCRERREITRRRRSSFERRAT